MMARLIYIVLAVITGIISSYFSNLASEASPRKEKEED